MKLTIVVAHYKESWEECKFLFDSINLQHGIDFNDFDVLVVNDGDDVVFDKSAWDGYKYKVNYVVKPHGGISDTRNYGIEHGDGEYVMFCDSDDGFVNNYGLHLVFSAIQEGFDFLHSSFIEEQPQDGGWKIYRRDKDLVFVHGKCYRRQFLLDKNIRFDTDMWFSEDSVFNKIAYHEAEKRKEITTPFYLWAWHDGSTVRKDRETLVLREYEQVIKMRLKICEQLKARGFEEEFKEAVCKTFFDCFYDFNEPVFLEKKHKAWRDNAEKQFKKFYVKYKGVFWECDSAQIAKIMMQSRMSAYESGLRMEVTDMKSWLIHIRRDVSI